MLGVIIKLILIGAVITIIPILIPQPITSAMTDAAIYFLSFINKLSPIAHVSHIFAAIKTLLDFTVSLALISGVMFIIRHS